MYHDILVPLAWADAMSDETVRLALDRDELQGLATDVRGSER